MLKKRLMFALLWNQGKYCLSRNFKLQKAGDLGWIKRNYNFQVIAFSIDELVVLNVSRGDKAMEAFAASVTDLTHGCFVPLAVGGGIRTLDHAALLLNSGADKLVLNTPLFTQPDLVRSIAQRYGRQCVVASIDYRRTPTGPVVMIENGMTPVSHSLGEAVAHARELGAGEILLTSMDQDGTGQGYDLETLLDVARSSPIPLIAAGGVGKNEHLASWLSRPEAGAAATANIFNFIGGGLIEARAHLDQVGIPLAHWDFQWNG
jgi:imidazole glycerol-phosphate synthase subunit HisF